VGIEIRGSRPADLARRHDFGKPNGDIRQLPLTGQQLTERGTDPALTLE
jgi:hypothetical protein